MLSKGAYKFTRYSQHLRTSAKAIEVYEILRSLQSLASFEKSCETCPTRRRGGSRRNRPLSRARAASRVAQDAIPACWIWRFPGMVASWPRSMQDAPPVTGASISGILKPAMNYSHSKNIHPSCGRSSSVQMAHTSLPLAVMEQSESGMQRAISLLRIAKCAVGTLAVSLCSVDALASLLSYGALTREVHSSQQVAESLDRETAVAMSPRDSNRDSLLIVPILRVRTRNELD